MPHGDDARSTDPSLQMNRVGRCAESVTAISLRACVCEWKGSEGAKEEQGRRMVRDVIGGASCAGHETDFGLVRIDSYTHHPCHFPIIFLRLYSLHNLLATVPATLTSAS